MKRALITGVTGQGGAYLSHLLLSKGYEVFGLVRRSSANEVIGAKLRWLGIEQEIRFVDGNITDLSSLIRIVREVRPRRNLQSRRPVIREGVVESTAADRASDRARCRQYA